MLKHPVLGLDVYTSIETAARQKASDALVAPSWSQFTNRVARKYPVWFERAIMLALLLTLIFSFFVSAGKQIAVLVIVLGDLPNKFTGLSSWWVDFSVVFWLFMSEIGAVLFLVAAGTIGEERKLTAVGKRQVNLTRWFFQAFAILFASYALIGNITITLLDPVPQASAFQWLGSVGVPLTVLGLGVMLEQILVDNLKSANHARAEYDKAMIEYERLLAKPDESRVYWAHLADGITRAIAQTRGPHQTWWKELRATEGSEEFVRMILAQEWRAQQARMNMRLDQVDIPFLSSGSRPTPPVK